MFHKGCVWLIDIRAFKSLGSRETYLYFVNSGGGTIQTVVVDDYCLLFLKFTLESLMLAGLEFKSDVKRVLDSWL